MNRPLPSDDQLIKGVRIPLSGQRHQLFVGLTHHLDNRLFLYLDDRTANRVCAPVVRLTPLSEKPVNGYINSILVSQGPGRVCGESKGPGRSR